MEVTTRCFWKLACILSGRAVFIGSIVTESLKSSKWATIVKMKQMRDRPVSLYYLVDDLLIYLYETQTFALFEEKVNFTLLFYCH